MSSIVETLYELKYNPFEYGSYLASFYSHLEQSENNLLLAQLVVPLCSHSFYSLKLNSLKTKSTIFTLFNGETKLQTEHDKEKYKGSILNPSQEKIVHRELLYDLQERIDGFQTLTEQCIQYCLINDWLLVNEKRLSLVKSDTIGSTFPSQKSAERLGRLFSGYSVIEIYAFLGVKPR